MIGRHGVVGFKMFRHEDTFYSTLLLRLRNLSSLRCLGMMDIECVCAVHIGGIMNPFIDKVFTLTLKDDITKLYN